MPEQNVICCPGCGKRYSVPPGVPPGQFQCQDCSSVVVYGKGGGPPQGHPGGGGSAKRAGRAAAARRRIHDRRPEEDGEGGERHGGGGSWRRREQANPMLYLAGFLVLALLAGGGFVLVKKSRPAETAAAPPPKARPAGGGGSVGADDVAAPAGGEAAPKAGPAPAAPVDTAAAGGGIRVESRKSAKSEEYEKFEPAANPPTGGNYDKTSAALRIMLKQDRASVVAPLDHLPDTAPQTRQKIDEDVAIIADPMVGSEALRAQRRLVQVGRAAIPRVLSAAAKYDFSKYKGMDEARDGCVVADAVDGILREVTSYEKFARLQYTREGRIDQYQKTIEDWYEWWLSMGHKRASFPRKPAAGDE